MSICTNCGGSVATRCATCRRSPAVPAGVLAEREEDRAAWRRGYEAGLCGRVQIGLDPSEPSDGFAAVDLDGDGLEIGLADEDVRSAYNAVLSVMCPAKAMYLDRHQVERLNDFLNEVLGDVA